MTAPSCQLPLAGESICSISFPAFHCSPNLIKGEALGSLRLKEYIASAGRILPGNGLGQGGFMQNIVMCEVL